MDKSIELSIIIVNFNSANLTLDLVKNLNSKIKNLSYEIIIVENNPESSDFEFLKEKFADKKNLTIKKNRQNSGFGAGNNFGAKLARGKYLMFLNPDTKILDNSIEKMLEFLKQHHEIAALSPLIYAKDEKTLQRHFFGKFMVANIFKKWSGGEETDLSKEFFFVDMVTGAAMMVKKMIFDKVGGFDQHFFMYVEDDDLCRQFYNLGYRNAVYTKAKIIHFEGQSSTSKAKKAMYYKSQNYYWKKYNGVFLMWLMRIIRSPYILVQKIFK